MEDAGKYIMDKYYARYDKMFGHRIYAYALHKLDLPNTNIVHMILNRKYHPRIRTLCRHMRIMGMIFGIRNILTNRIELVTNDADTILNFLKTQRRKRSGRNSLIIACRCCRRDNVSVGTLVRAFRELGYTIQIGEYANA